jgi:hypothetical protein
MTRLLPALGYKLIAALLLGVLFIAGVIVAMSLCGVAAVRSDAFAAAPILYLLLIPPCAALLAYRKAARIKRAVSE